MIIVILCADDFAMTPGISIGICELLKNKRLSAASCMSISPLWREHATWLKSFKNKADIGLHLTLTDFPSLGPLSFTNPQGHLPPFGKLMNLAYGNHLDCKEITMEFQRQFDAFTNEFGSTPDFLDGHQHVHQLPVIRNSIIELFKKNLRNSKSYLRICWENPFLVWKRKVSILRTLSIGLPGLKLRRLAKRRGIHFNNGFSGVYDLSSSRNFNNLFKSFLIGIGEQSLIICHPGKNDSGLTSESLLGENRESEFLFLNSPAFLSTLDKEGIRLGRFSNFS